MTLSEDDRSLLILALQEKADADEQRAAMFADDPRHSRLATTFANQAKRALHLVDVINSADSIAARGLDL